MSNDSDTAAAAAAAASSTSSSSMPWGLARHESLEWSYRGRGASSSRHRTDFECLQFLGRGAFGICHKVKNRVDRRVYCLKSIANANELVLREVEVLSSLPSHDNVVRYYGAFVEKLGADARDELLQLRNEKNRSSNDRNGTPSSENGHEWTISYPSSFSDASTGDDDDDNNTKRPSCHLCQSTYTDWEVSFEHWGLIDAVLQPHNLCIPCYTKSLPLDEVDASKISIRQQPILQDYLFIWMEFCEATLPQAIAASSNDKNMIWNYFRQAVRGVAHLHDQGVIHRDIKPHNIFVHKGIVKIGDLGLATIAKRSIPSTNHGGSDSLHDPDNDSHHDDEDATTVSKSSQVGTFLYTAPEVARGKYDQACDVYSLGVLLVEIFCTFSTAMERVAVLSHLASRPLPRDWTEVRATPLVQSMTSLDPTERPTCLSILSTLDSMGIKPCSRRPDDIDGNDENNDAVRESNSINMVHQMAKLQSELRSSQAETKRLQKLLEDHNIPY